MDPDLKKFVTKKGLKAWLAVEEPAMLGHTSTMVEIAVSETSFGAPSSVGTVAEYPILGGRTGAVGGLNERLIEEIVSSYLPSEADPLNGPNLGYSPVNL